MDELCRVHQRSLNSWADPVNPTGLGGSLPGRWPVDVRMAGDGPLNRFLLNPFVRLGGLGVFDDLWVMCGWARARTCSEAIGRRRKRLWEACHAQRRRCGSRSGVIPVQPGRLPVCRSAGYF